MYKCSFFRVFTYSKTQESSFDMATGYGLDGRGPFPGKDTFFLFPVASRQVMRPTQPPIQRVLEAVSPGVKPPGYEAHYSLPSCAEFKNDGAIPSLPPYVFMARCLVN
jgi:hypothetical protein